MFGGKIFESQKIIVCCSLLSFFYRYRKLSFPLNRAAVISFKMNTNRYNAQHSWKAGTF